MTEQSPQEARQDRGRLREQGAAEILGFATQGAGGNEEQRLRGLLSRLPAEIFPFERRDKLGCFWGILQRLRGRRYRLVVMEGSGVAGGSALLLGRWLYGSRYVVSSGDAIAPFLRARWPLAAPIFEFLRAVALPQLQWFHRLDPVPGGSGADHGSAASRNRGRMG